MVSNQCQRQPWQALVGDKLLETRKKTFKAKVARLLQNSLRTHLCKNIIIHCGNEMAHIGVNDKTASAEVVEKRLKVSRTSVQQVSTGLVLATVERIILIRIKKDGILL